VCRSAGKSIGTWRQTLSLPVGQPDPPMTAGARALRFEEARPERGAVTPPPTRHALFVVLIALAALLHVATIGSGDLYSQTEGQDAGAAKGMGEAQNGRAA